MQAWKLYMEAMGAAGVLRDAKRLEQFHGTAVRVRDGKRQVQDGPFADTKERLGGVFVIDVPDLDAALEWAKRCPAADWGSIEIRPVAVTYARGTGWYTPE